ncbi:MAG TPA: hypothetical protein VH917_01865 [Ignavibacteriaceae bacterium]|jgi:hypothetical protein
MKKKLFHNYNFEFDKNEKKLLITFCRQALKQIGGEEKYFNEARAFNSVLDKLQSDSGEVKLTKDEKTKLTLHLKQNMDYIGKQAAKSWFLKKWLMKSLHKQYTSLLQNHFEE